MTSMISKPGKEGLIHNTLIRNLIMILIATEFMFPTRSSWIILQTRILWSWRDSLNGPIVNTFTFQKEVLCSIQWPLFFHKMYLKLCPPCHEHTVVFLGDRRRETFSSLEPPDSVRGLRTRMTWNEIRPSLSGVKFNMAAEDC